MESAFWNGFMLHNFLFKYVHITTPLELVVTCVVTAALAFLFEGTRTLRDWLYVEFLRRRSCHGTTSENPMLMRERMTPEESQNGKTKSDHCHANPPVVVTEVNTNTNVIPVIGTGTISGSGKDCKKPQFHVGILQLSCSTVLHMCQVVLGYVLMLVVMTFNVWIFVAVLVGTSIGFFIFDGFNKKIHVLKMNANISSSTKK